MRGGSPCKPSLAGTSPTWHADKATKRSAGCQLYRHTARFRCFGESRSLHPEYRRSGPFGSNSIPLVANNRERNRPGVARGAFGSRYLGRWPRFGLTGIATQVCTCCLARLRRLLRAVAHRPGRGQPGSERMEPRTANRGRRNRWRATCDRSPWWLGERVARMPRAVVGDPVSILVGVQA